MKIQAIVQGVRTMVDGGFRVQLDVQELDPDTARDLFFLKGKFIDIELREDANNS